MLAEQPEAVHKHTSYPADILSKHEKQIHTELSEAVRNQTS